MCETAPRILIFAGDVVEVRPARVPAEPHLELVEDLAVPDLLRLPHVGVERPVDRRRVRQHRDQLEDVAVHLELDPGHVVEDVAVPLARAGAGCAP